MGNKTTVAINFQGLNLDTILANLKEINTLSGKVQLPKNLIDQINDLTQAVEAMKASTATLGKTKVDSKEYKEFVANITKAFNELNQRVTVLEQAMTTIGKSQDVSGIVNSINKIKDNAVEATDAINKMNETTNMVSKNRTTAKSIDIKSYQKLLDLFTKIKELEDSSIGDNSAIGKKANSMTSKTVIKNLREQLELAQDLQAELDNIYSSKKLGNGKKFFEIAEQLKSTLNIIDKLQARYESINGEGTLAKIEFAPGFKTNMDESIVDVENGFRDFIKDISKQVDIVNKKIATIPQQTKEVSKEIKQSSDSTKSEAQEGLSLGKTKYSKSKSQITIPLHLRKDEYEKFKKEIDVILEQIQDNIKPLEVRVALVSGYKTKKTEELASQLQNDLSNLDDKEIRGKVSDLIDNLQRSFDTDLHMKIEVEGGKEATDIVKKVVKELKAELKKGIKSTNIDAEFGEKTLEKLNKQLSTIKPIRVNLGKDEEEVGKEYAPLTLLKKTIDNIKKSITEKTDAFKEEVKTVENQSALEIKYLTPLIDSFLTLKEVLSNITSLSGQIGDVKFSIDSDNLSKLVQTSTIVSDVVNETIDTSANKKKRQINNNPSKASKNNTDIQKENVALEKQNTLEKATVDIIKEKNKAKEKEEKISENILGLTKEEIAWAQSGDIGDSAGFLSSEELEKELTIARELSSEYKEQGKQQKLTNEEIENGFQIIKKYVNSDQYGNYNLSKKKDKEWLTFWTDRYIKYQEAGGQRPISDLTDNKKILEKYQKEYDKQKSSFINENSISATNEKVKELKTDLEGAEKELDTFYKVLIGVPKQFEEARDNLVKMVEDGLITGLEAAKKLNKEISLIKLKEEQSEKSFQEIKKTITDKGNYNLRKQSDRNELSKIVEQFITYQQKEGKHPLSDLTDNQKLLDKLDKEYQKQYSTIASSAPISAKEVSEVTEEISEANKQLDVFYKMLVSVPEKFENIRDDFDSKVRNGLLSGVDAAKELNKQMSLYKLHLKETEENYKKQSESFEERFINEGYDNTKLSKLLDDIEETKSKLHQEYDATGGSKDAEGLITIYNNLDKLSEQIADTLKKNATISNDITSEVKNEVVQTQEVSKFVGKTNEELQQCLVNEEKWLAKCKEGSDAYNRRKANIEEINALLSASTPLDKNNLSSDTNRITEQARAEMQAEEAAYDARVKAEAAAKREMESEEAAYDASVRAKVEAERAGEAIAESQDRAQKELLNTVSILEELNKLVSPTKIASSKNIQGFNDSLGGLFGDNKSFEKTLRILKEWLKTFNEVKKNGSRTIGNFGAISGVTDAKFIENQNSLAQKLGYNIKWNTDDQGYLHGIVSESENAVKSLDEVFERIFNINELVAKSNKTPDSSKINSIKDESKVIEQQTVKIEENTKAQRENKNEKSNADPKVNLTNEMAETGSDSIDGLTEGIKAKEQQYFDTMEGVMQEGVNIARKTIGAESPARKYIKVSEDAVDGLIVGLKNKEEEYFTAIREMMQKATSIIQEETANIGTNIKFGEGLEKATKYLQELSKALNTLGGSKSDEKINKLQENMQKLQSVFSTFKGRKNNLLTQIETILQKGNELKSLADVLKSSQKSIDSATKATNRKQQESQAKTTASENLSKYEDDIRKGLQDIISKNQWTVLSSQMEPYKDGLIHITTLIKDLDGQYKELVYTTENGKIFNSESIKDTDISINKKAQAYEKYQQMLERLNIGAEAIGEVTPESDNWQRLVDLMEEFGIEAENAVRIIRQVDEVGHESFQVFDALGNKKTIGVSSKDFLAIKETVNDSSKAIKEYNDLIQSLAKYSKKNFNLSNLEAQQFLDTLDKFPSAWKQIQSGVNAGSISSDDFIKLRESYNTVLKDFQNEWFSEKQLPRIRPEYISQYKELKNDLDNIILAMQNSPNFPQQDSISSLSEFINKAKEFYKIQDQINIKMTDSGTVDKLLGKIGDNLVRNSSMSRELSNDFKNLRDRIKSMRDVTNGMLPTDEFNKFNTEFQKLVRIMKETGQTGLGFFDLVGQKIKGISASLIAQYLSLQDWIRYFRTAFETIHQLDTALVDLKKTTTMSNSELEDFYHNSSRLAKQMGVSSEEIISQASAWSRLGYSSKEAAESMAELSSQFAKISPGTSVEDATDYLVSTMKAFNIDVTNVESDIMDSINRIGNTMATSNQEVGEMLKRSSAAMAAANNSLAETIALESAAVQITRNAETTGINSAA